MLSYLNTGFKFENGGRKLLQASDFFHGKTIHTNDIRYSRYMATLKPGDFNQWNVDRNTYSIFTQGTREYKYRAMYNDICYRLHGARLTAWSQPDRRPLEKK